MSGPSTAAVAEAAAPAGGLDKRPQVEAFLSDVFRLMDYPVRLDFKDQPDGSLAVAVHVDGEQPGITPGKKSFLVDSVQFLVNKAVNRPNEPRRWINLGVNGFPEPRPPQGSPAAAAAAPKRSAPPAPVAASAPRPAKPAERREERKGALERARDEAKDRSKGGGARGEVDEASLSVTPDAAWTAVAKALAEKSAKLGRPYAVMLMTPEDRARLVQSAAGVKGVSVRVEGDGCWRRVAFKPDKPTPMPKKSVMPDYGDEDE